MSDFILYQKDCKTCLFKLVYPIPTCRTEYRYFTKIINCPQHQLLAKICLTDMDFKKKEKEFSLINHSSIRICHCNSIRMVSYSDFTTTYIVIVLERLGFVALVVVDFPSPGQHGGVGGSHPDQLHEPLCCLGGVLQLIVSVSGSRPTTLCDTYIYTSY